MFSLNSLLIKNIENRLGCSIPVIANRTKNSHFNLIFLIMGKNEVVSFFVFLQFVVFHAYFRLGKVTSKSETKNVQNEWNGGGYK